MLRKTPLRRGSSQLRRTGFKKKPKNAATRRTRATSRIPKPKVKVWTLKRADAEFSMKIRERDGKCLHPAGCAVTDIKKLQCSHYIGRQHKATRFDPDNCIALCWLHHFKDKLLGFEYQKQITERHGYDGGYTLYMKNWLGEEKFIALMQRGASVKSQWQAIYDFQYQNQLT